MYLDFYGSHFECSWFEEESILPMLHAGLCHRCREDGPPALPKGSFAGRLNSAKTVLPGGSTFLFLFVFCLSPYCHWLQLSHVETLRCSQLNW